MDEDLSYLDDPFVPNEGVDREFKKNAIKFYQAQRELINE
jgi:hypothetical protein